MAELPAREYVDLVLRGIGSETDIAVSVMLKQLGMARDDVTITQQASLPPLGLAFLIGYAVDVFFTFLEGLIRVFTRTPQNSPLPPSPPSRSPLPKDMHPTG